MPIYEYHCRECDQTFEEIVSANTPIEEIACPYCGEHKAEREMSVFSSNSDDYSYSSSYSSSSSSSGCGSSGFS